MKIRLITTATTVAALLGVFASPVAFSASQSEMIKQGQSIAFNRKLGNCLACHVMAGGTAMGAVAPPLVAMKARYPDKKALRAQIWNASAKNPDTFMPPFGRHHILTEKQIDMVTDFVYSL